MERTIGSMGSEYTRLHLDPEVIPLLAKLDWNIIARRVFIEPVSGLIALMTPSAEHERYSRGADRFMDAMGRSLGVNAIGLGSTRWRLPGDPENTGAEPDACYYLGPTADRWTEADGRGAEAVRDFEARTPPDLVIEVERSHGDGDKPDFYRRLGVPEMWRLDIAGNTREAVLLGLEAPGGPEELTVSAVLAPASPAFVLAALELAAKGRISELDTLIGEQISAAAGGNRLQGGLLAVERSEGGLVGKHAERPATETLRRIYEFLLRKGQEDCRFVVKETGEAPGKCSVRFHRGDGYPFSFIVNSGKRVDYHLFYVRFPRRGQKRLLTVEFGSEAVANNQKGEITIRIGTIEDAQRIWKHMEAFSDRFGE